MIWVMYPTWFSRLLVYADLQEAASYPTSANFMIDSWFSWIREPEVYWQNSLFHLLDSSRKLICFPWWALLDVPYCYEHCQYSSISDTNIFNASFIGSFVYLEAKRFLMTLHLRFLHKAYRHDAIHFIRLSQFHSFFLNWMHKTLVDSWCFFNVLGQMFPCSITFLVFSSAFHYLCHIL